MFYKYFLEIKNRVVLIFNSWILTMVTCYFYKNILLFLLIKLNSNLYKLKSFYFITTNFTDIFSVCLQIGSFISIQCLILLSVYHFITFITPGLFKFEYKLLKLIIVVCCLLFCISIIFFHLFFYLFYVIFF
jgi:Sec-independent protein secretion pathway component TatC